LANKSNEIGFFPFVAQLIGRRAAGGYWLPVGFGR
jgi:hypothetical protein